MNDYGSVALILGAYFWGVLIGISVGRSRQ